MSEQYRVSGKSLPLEKSSGAPEVELRPGGWLLVTDPATGLRRKVMLAQARTVLGASVAGALWHGEIIRKERNAGGGAGGGDSDLVAQFPGKVRKLLVAEGAKVNEGDPLLLVEAMKMEFSVKAPASGKVTKVLVREGQQLSPGDRFLELEPNGA